MKHIRFLPLQLIIIAATTAACRAYVQTIDEKYITQGNTFRDEGALEKALEYYRTAQNLNPESVHAAKSIAEIYLKNNDLDRAIEQYTKAVTLQPDSADMLYDLGMCLTKHKKTDEALVYLDQATTQNPGHVKAHLQRATLLQEKKQNKNAIAAYEQAVAHDATLFDAHYTLGKLKRDESLFDDAVLSFRKAHALKPSQTNIMLELANTLNMMEFEQAHEALELYKKIIELNPHSLPALYNYGYTLKKLGHIEHAVEIYDKVLKKSPDYALAHFSRAVSRLMLGDFENGWPEYEWRWKTYSEKPRVFQTPMWNGSDIAGKRIYLYSEQGLGDTLQFIRYAQVLKQKGAYVIFQTQRALKKLLSLCPHIDELYATGEKVSAFDEHCPLMSLPMVLNTRVETVPCPIPYLHADETLVAQWKEKLSHDKNFKIGICWQGNAQYSTQFLRQAVAAKSMSVATFAPLTQVPGVSVYSLQKVFGTDQMKNLPAGVTIHDFGADFDESNGAFMDTVAIMKNLDLIISIDTSICHCAGGLGVRVWNLLPQPADWRWMVNTLESPWYPNMRLFRQATPGDWDSVMQDVVTQVQQLLAAPLAHVMPHAVTKQTAPMPECARTPEHHDDVQTLAKQMQQINRTIAQLEHQLFNAEHRAITDDYAELARKAYYAHNAKKNLMNQLRSLTQQ